MYIFLKSLFSFILIKYSRIFPINFFDSFISCLVCTTTALTHLRAEKKRPGLCSKRGTPFCSISRSLDASRLHSFLKEKEEQAVPFRVGKKKE